jgi:hypothetical protein
MENNFSQVLQSQPQGVRGVVMPADTSMQNLAEGLSNVAGTVAGAYDIYKTNKAVDAFNEGYADVEADYSSEVSQLNDAMDKGDAASAQNPKNAIASRARVDSLYKSLVNSNPRAASALRRAYEERVGGSSKMEQDFEVQSAARKTLIDAYMKSGQPLYKNGAYVTEDDMVNWYQDYQATMATALTPSSQVSKAQKLVNIAAPSVTTRLSTMIKDVSVGKITKQQGLAMVGQFKMQMENGFRTSVGYGMFEGKNNSTLDNMWKTYDETFTMAVNAISGKTDSDIATNALKSAQDTAELELMNKVGLNNYTAFKQFAEALKLTSQEEYTALSKKVTDAYRDNNPSMITNANEARATVSLGKPQYATTFMANASGEELVNVLSDMSGLDTAKWDESKEEWGKLPKNAYNNALRNIQSEVIANIAPSVLKVIKDEIEQQKSTSYANLAMEVGAVRSYDVTNISPEDLFGRLKLNVVNNMVAFTADTSGLNAVERSVVEKARRQMNSSKATKALGGYLKLRSANPTEALTPTEAVKYLNIEIFGRESNPIREVDNAS